jgi:hypothetical protein
VGAGVLLQPRVPQADRRGQGGRSVNALTCPGATCKTSVWPWVHVSAGWATRLCCVGGCFTRGQQQGHGCRARRRTGSAGRGIQGKRTRVRERPQASWRRALEIGNMTSCALLLALAVSVLVHSSTVQRCIQLPFCPSTQPPPRGDVRDPLHPVLCCSAFARPPSPRPGRAKASVKLWCHGKRAPRQARRMHQPTHDLHPSVSILHFSASAQQHTYHGSHA